MNPPRQGKDQQPCDTPFQSFRFPQPPQELAMTTLTATASTTALATTADLILALDLGNYKTVACAYPGAPAAARFESLTTDRDHLRKLLEERARVGASPRESRLYERAPVPAMVPATCVPWP